MKKFCNIISKTVSLIINPFIFVASFICYFPYFLFKKSNINGYHIKQK